MVRFAVAVLAAVAVASPVAGDEASQRAYSKGLVEWNASGSAQSAMAHFTAAVQADPQDAFAHYHLGMARASLGETAAAIEDLRTALRLRPDFPIAAADLGVLLVRENRPAEALPWLEAATAEPRLRGRAKLMSGVARLRLGEIDAAVEDLRAAVALDPTIAAEARYYEGVAESRRGDDDAAREHFEWVVREHPTSAVAFEAQRFLDGAGSGDRPYLIYAAIGLDYDSNVTLETDAEIGGDDLQPSDNADGNVHFRVGARYRLWGNENTALTAGYELFQRVYFELDEYNLQAHRPGLRLSHRWNDFFFGVAADYDFFLLQTESYLQRVSGLPWVAMHTGDWGRSELSYRLRWNDFFRRPPDSAVADPDGDIDDDVLDSISHMPILRQYFYVDGADRYVSAAWVFERRNPVGDGDELYAYTANGVELAVAWALAWQLSAQAEYMYQYQDYDEEGRVDEPHQVVVGLRRPIVERLFATAAYRGLFHESNQFPYDRHIGSLTLEYVF